jgi:hypothetical protein
VHITSSGPIPFFESEIFAYEAGPLVRKPIPPKI